MIDRLYGQPGAEHMHDTIAGVWESTIEPVAEGETGPWTVEEWTVHDPLDHLPSVDWLTGLIFDAISDADVVEGFLDDVDRALGTADVRDAAAALLRLIASKINYRMAKKCVAVHTVTVVDGEPQVNGTPLYVEAS